MGRLSRRKAHFLHVLLKDGIEVAEVHHCVHDCPVASDVSQSWKARAFCGAFAAAIVSGLLKLFLIRHLFSALQRCSDILISFSFFVVVVVAVSILLLSLFWQEPRNAHPPAPAVSTALQYNDAYREYMHRKKEEEEQLQRSEAIESRKNPIEIPGASDHFDQRLV